MIKNLNKRLIASGVALTLLPSILAGCTAGFKYEEDNNHQIVVSGSIPYNYLKECYYVEIENPDYDKTEYYIAERKEYHPYFSPNRYEYIDILTGKKIFQRKMIDNSYYTEKSNDYNSARFIKKEIKVEDYLFSENFIKNAYDVNDVKQIFEAIKENEQSKKMVKE